jgi:hypothetical protein
MNAVLVAVKRGFYRSAGLIVGCVRRFLRPVRVLPVATARLRFAPAQVFPQRRCQPLVAAVTLG